MFTKRGEYAKSQPEFFTTPPVLLSGKISALARGCPRSLVHSTNMRKNCKLSIRTMMPDNLGPSFVVDFWIVHANTFWGGRGGRCFCRAAPVDRPPPANWSIDLERQPERSRRRDLD